MRGWLHALVLLAVVLLFGVSFALLSTLVGIFSPWLALLLMLYFSGIARFAQPLLMLRMPKGLYRLRRWEEDDDALRRLQIPAFGRLLRQTPLRFLNSGVYLDRRQRDPHKVRLHIESAEAIHFWAAVMFTPFIVVAALAGEWTVVAWFLLAQVLFNAYPILPFAPGPQASRSHQPQGSRRPGGRRNGPVSQPSCTSFPALFMRWSACPD